MSEFLDIVDNPFLGIFWGSTDTTPDTTDTTSEEATVSQSVAATPQAKQTSQFVVRLGTCNVQNTPDIPARKVKRCGELASREFDLLGTQEMGEFGQDRTDFLAGLGPRWSMPQIPPIGNQEIIAWISELFNVNHSKWHEVIPAGQPYPNPARGWSEAVIAPIHGFPFRFVDTHFVNKAWNDVPDTHKALRKRNWEIHYQALAAFVRTSSRTLPTVVVGDFNRTTVKPFGTNFRWLATGSSEHNVGIDKVGIALPKGFGVQNLGHINVSNPSDHNAVGCKLRLIRK